MLMENLLELKRYRPHIWNNIRNITKLEDVIEQSNIKVEEAKSSVRTLSVVHKNRNILLHSRYDPKKEAEILVEKYEKDIEQYKHIFFYGVGIGYHIEELMKRFPMKQFYLYEPSPEVFYYYLKFGFLRKLPLRHLKEIYIENAPADTQHFSYIFLNSVYESVLFISLPSYQQAFPESFDRFNQQFIQSATRTRSAVVTNFGYSKPWTINSVLNFSEVLKTPNIMHDIEPSLFKDKPVILAAAGPSLQEELDNLKYIKDHGLAYIFSVGSSINALLDKGIYPDAVFTYDPNFYNKEVYRKLIDQEIKDIPMVFGSSVGYGTPQEYPGPKFHMLTSQDTISPFFLRHRDSDKLFCVNDSSTIAALALQIIHKLGCNPVIFVGQNLSFKNNQYYADSIKYEDQRLLPWAGWDQNTVFVEDVYGNQVATAPVFNNLKEQIEMYIGVYNKSQTFINATKGGAKITGTTFQALESLIGERLQSRVVISDWFKQVTNPNYDNEAIKEKERKMRESYQLLIELIAEITKPFKELDNLPKNADGKQAEKVFNKFDKNFKKIIKNDFFRSFILPMNRVQWELLIKSVEKIRLEKDYSLKASQVVQEFGKFVYGCKKDLDLITPLYNQLRQSIDAVFEQEAQIS